MKYQVTCKLVDVDKEKTIFWEDGKLTGDEILTRIIELEAQKRQELGMEVSVAGGRNFTDNLLDEPIAFVQLIEDVMEDISDFYLIDGDKITEDIDNEVVY